MLRASSRLSRLNVALAGAGTAAAIASLRTRSLTQCSGSAASTSPIQLYQYKICPFCNKVKAYLDYTGVDYVSVEVNPLSKSELAFTKEHKKVPVAVINGEVVAESSVIIDKITDLLTKGKGIVAKKPDKSFYPTDTTQWAEWADKKLAVMLYPNITRSLEESWECFQYADSVESWNLPMRYATRVAGTVAMSIANGKIKKKYGIVDERAELKTELLVWTDALKTNDFLHGKKITMPDLMVYGVLRAIEGLQTFDVIMTENARLKVWYDRVKQQIPPSSSAK